MKYKKTYIFHTKDIKTPLIWALFDEIKRDYGQFVYFLKYKEDYDYYAGFSGREKNYKTVPIKIWNTVVDKIQLLLNKHNKQAYDEEYDKYIKMTDNKKLYELYKI
jgi:hypothetical protein